MVYLNIYSVSELTHYIKTILERDQRLGSLLVRGELSNYKRHQSGHCYFTLKDGSSVIRGVMFRSRAQFLKFEPRDGMKIIAGGHIAVFERDGQYQLYAEQLIPDGVGELSLAYAQLKDKLTREGLFEESRKQPLPLLPKTVGVITSPTGAAVRDIITVSKRRCPGVSLVLYPVHVQGAEAPPEICHAIDVFNRLYPVDVLIVGRGGGSLEELWAFNDERVVRAVAASAIPVVSAVGHETDFTLSDFAADRRAATPSQAAELVVPDVQELGRFITALTVTLETRVKNLLHKRKQHLEMLQKTRVLRSPHDMLTARQQMLDGQTERLLQAFRSVFADKQQAFQLAAEKLNVLNPLAVLARGFSVTRKPDGTVIRRVGDIQPGDRVEIVLRDGTLGAHVTHKEETSEKN